MYAASEGLSTLILEREAIGGQAGTTSLIRNYLGFPRGISGRELASRAMEQALVMGAEIVFVQSAVRLAMSGSKRVLSIRRKLGRTVQPCWRDLALARRIASSPTPAIAGGAMHEFTSWRDSDFAGDQESEAAIEFLSGRQRASLDRRRLVGQ